MLEYNGGLIESSDYGSDGLLVEPIFAICGVTQRSAAPFPTKHNAVGIVTKPASGSLTIKGRVFRPKIDVEKPLSLAMPIVPYGLGEARANYARIEATCNCTPRSSWVIPKSDLICPLRIR